MSSFVGRQKELERLHAHLREAEGGRGRIVFITGEPGAGKSTLVNQFMLDAAISSPGMRVIGAACSEQYGAPEPYQPFVEAFKSLLTEQEEPGGGGTWTSLKEIAAEVAPHWIAAIPVAGGLIAAGINTAVELKRGGVATAASEEALFFQYTELFLSAAALTPIVLLIDDLHWADTASVSLLSHLARRVEKERVLILGTYRPADVDLSRHPIRDARLELERYGIAVEYPLSPLDSAANAELIAEELGAPPTPELLDWIEAQAGSNPLFLAELLKWMSEQGLVKERHGEMTLVHVPDEIEIPRSAEATIERRLSRLDTEVYKLVEYASVEGTEFASTTLAQLLAMDELELEEALDPVAKIHRIIRFIDTRDLPSGDLASIYVFSHSLMRDVLHRNLQGKRRILLHRKMAEILEQLHARNPAAIAHKLAIHFDEGRLAARAYEFALMGAERARRMYAHRDAVELIRRALRNAQDDGQKLEALELLGETTHFIGHYPDAVQAYMEALDIARARADGEREIRLRRKIVHVERDRGGSRPERVEIEWTALAERAREIGADAELCEILWLLNGLPAAQGSERAIERAREALAICERAGDRARIAQAHASLARAIAFGPDGMAARPHLEAGLALFEELGDRFRLGSCYNLLGILHAMAADYRAASGAFRAAAEAFDEVGAPSHEAGVRNNLGVILTRFGDLQQAEENLREAIRLNVRLDATATLLHPLENLADLFQVAERWEEARAQWKALLDVAHEAGYWNAEVIALCGNGVAALAQGEIETARGDEAAAAAILADHQSWSEARAAYHYLSAKIADAMGERDGAIHFLGAAEEELASRDRYTWATFRLLRAELLAATSPAEADALARDVLTVFEQIGSGRMRERALALITTPPPTTPGEP